MPEQGHGKGPTSGYLYVLHFTDGMIKVGQAVNAISRIASHRSEGARHGNAIREQWVSAPCHAFEAREAELIAWCHRQPGAVTRSGSREWFIGLDYAKAVAAAQRLTNPLGPFTEADRNMFQRVKGVKTYHRHLLAGLEACGLLASDVHAALNLIRREVIEAVVYEGGLADPDVP